MFRPRPAHSILLPGPESRAPFNAPGAFWTAACFLLAYLLFLGKNRLLGLDEAMYAKAALSAAREGAWLPLFFEGEPFWEKPPLILWLQGLSLTLLGPTEVAVRLWSALAGAGTLFFVHRLGEFLGKSPWTGFACAFLLGLQPHFILYSRLGTMDMPLLLCLTGAWWSLTKALALPGQDPGRAMGQAGLWCVCGVFIKSWFGLVLLPAMAGAILLGKAGERMVRPFLSRVLAPVLLAVAAWLVLFRAVYGAAFLEWEFGHNVLDRLRSASLAPWARDPGHAFKFYGTLAQEGLAFLWPLLPLGLGLWTRKILREGGDPVWRGAVCLGCLFFFYYLSFITCSMATLINYLLPLLPAGALACAFLLERGGARGWAGAALLLSVLNGVSGFEAWTWVFPLSLLLGIGLLRPFPWPKIGGFFWVIGLGLLGLGCVLKAQDYLRHPPDPNRVWVKAVLDHPARAPGQTLLFLGEHTDARVLGFYSGYRVKVLTQLPKERPQEALLFQEGPRAVFLPAPER